MLDETIFALSTAPARAALDKGLARGFAAWLPSRTRAVARKYGMDAQWERQALAIARERFVDPNDIALFRIERPEELDHYIRRFEDAGFNKIENFLAGRLLLNANGNLYGTDPLDSDKGTWGYCPGLQFKIGRVEPASFTTYTVVEIKPFTRKRAREE